MSVRVLALLSTHFPVDVTKPGDTGGPWFRCSCGRPLKPDWPSNPARRDDWLRHFGEMLDKESS